METFLHFIRFRAWLAMLFFGFVLLLFPIGGGIFPNIRGDYRAVTIRVENIVYNFKDSDEGFLRIVYTGNMFPTGVFPKKYNANFSGESAKRIFQNLPDDSYVSNDNNYFVSVGNGTNNRFYLSRGYIRIKDWKYRIEIILDPSYQIERCILFSIMLALVFSCWCFLIITLEILCFGSDWSASEGISPRDILAFKKKVLYACTPIFVSHALYFLISIAFPDDYLRYRIVASLGLLLTFADSLLSLFAFEFKPLILIYWVVFGAGSYNIYLVFAFFTFPPDPWERSLSYETYIYIRVLVFTFFHIISLALASYYQKRKSAEEEGKETKETSFQSDDSNL